MAEDYYKTITTDALKSTIRVDSPASLASPTGTTEQGETGSRLSETNKDAIKLEIKERMQP